MVYLFCLGTDPSSSVQIVYPTAPVVVSVQLSQPLTLECIISGSPAPPAKWFKNNKEITLRPSHRRQHNNLAFSSVTRSDEGRYACTIETEQGNVVSASYTVVVLGKKQAVSCVYGHSLQQMIKMQSCSILSSTEPASLMEGLTNQLVSTGSSAHFACAVKGTPSPNITWLFNADPITPSQRFYVSGPSLVVTDVTSQDEGVYQCLLDNGIGSAQSNGMLKTQPGLYLPV